MTVDYPDSVSDDARTPRSGDRQRRAQTSGPWSSLPTPWQQAVLVGIIIGLTALLARVGLGTFARVFFVVAAIAAAAVYARRSPWHYVILTFWFWTLTPLARRLIDYSAGFDPVNIVLATPNLMTLFMLKDVLTSRDLLRQRETLLGMLLLLPILYGLCVSLIQGAVIPGLVASADWIAPVLYYFYFVTNWRRIGEAEEPFRQFLSVNGLILISYGISQYFAPQAWDVAWVNDSGLTSIGRPLPYGMRIFGTLNLPGLLAIWLGTMLVLFLHFRTRLCFLLVPAGVLLLLMTSVRSVAGTVVLGLLLAAVMGRAGTFRFLGAALLAVALLGGGLSAINPAMMGQFAKRFDTLNNLSVDESAREREALYRAAPALIAAYPLGMGIGALGRGAVATQNADLVSVDAGPLAIYLALGWIGGSVHFVGIILVLSQALSAARMTRSPAALALAVTAVADACNLVFVGMAGFFAACVWTCAAYAMAIGIAYRNQRQIVPAR